MPCSSDWEFHNSPMIDCSSFFSGDAVGNSNIRKCGQIVIIDLLLVRVLLCDPLPNFYCETVKSVSVRYQAHRYSSALR